MTEEIINEEAKHVENCQQKVVKHCQKAKRDIFHFNGERPTAINLEHVTRIMREANRITFCFYSDAIYIDLADDAAAEELFKILLTAWSGDVLE
jgi:energy-converting hydrogenase A subunit M